MGINLHRKYAAELAPEILIRRFKDIQASESNLNEVQVSDSLVILKVPEADQSWWSPEMNLRIETEDAQTRIAEVIGPNPGVFTLAMFFIILGSVALIFTLILALSLFQLGNSPVWAIAGTMLSIFMVAGTLAILGYGRIQAVEQVKDLREYVSQVIEAKPS